MQQQPETLDADVTVSCCAARLTVGDKLGDVTDERCRVGFATDDERHFDVIFGDAADTKNCCDVTVTMEFETSEVSSSQSAQLDAVDHADKVTSMFSEKHTLSSLVFWHWQVVPDVPVTHFNNQVICLSISDGRRPNMAWARSDPLEVINFWR